ncbi:MAG TPA: T9SS type A sorting domain-containing protein [Ignavibacteriaceae bacterium]|nr:T9SS type A sorting domain-containing protein [Ignavibacteriaceae bacterium]
MILTAAPQTSKDILTGFYLEQNDPNPFNRKTTIKFCLSNQSKVTVLITNSYGKVVDKLISSFLNAGMYEIGFIADGLSRGTYFCHVVADNYSHSQEMELIK